MSRIYPLMSPQGLRVFSSWLELVTLVSRNRHLLGELRVDGARFAWWDCRVVVLSLIVSAPTDCERINRAVRTAKRRDRGVGILDLVALEKLEASIMTIRRECDHGGEYVASSDI